VVPCGMGNSWQAGLSGLAAGRPGDHRHRLFICSPGCCDESASPPVVSGDASAPTMPAHHTHSSTSSKYAAEIPPTPSFLTPKCTLTRCPAYSRRLRVQ